MELARIYNGHYDQDQWIQWRVAENRPPHNLAFEWWPLWDKMDITEEGGFHSKSQVEEYAPQWAKKRSQQLVADLKDIYTRTVTSKFGPMKIGFLNLAEDEESLRVIITGFGLDARTSTVPRSVFTRLTDASCWPDFHDMVIHAANSIHHKHYEEAEAVKPDTVIINGQTA